MGLYVSQRKTPQVLQLRGFLLPSGSLNCVYKATQLVTTARVLQFTQRLGFNLTNALARDIELFANLFQGVVAGHLDTKTHAQHFGFAWGEAKKVT